MALYYVNIYIIYTDSGKYDNSGSYNIQLIELKLD